MCVIPDSLIGRALSRKDRGAGFESRSWILLLQHWRLAMARTHDPSYPPRARYGVRTQPVGAGEQCSKKDP